MNVKYRAIAIFAVLALVGTLTAASASAGATQDSVSESGSPTLEDNSGHILGSLVDASTSITGPQGGSYITADFYSSSLNLLVPVGPAGNPGIPFAEEFISTNCTGTGYLTSPAPQQYANPPFYLSLLAGSGGGYFKLQNTQPESLSMNSTLEGSSCDLMDGASQLAVPVTSIKSLPFPTPIALPLRLAG